MSSKTLRVLYSFPDDIGSAGIGATAWYQVTGLAQEGVEVHVHPTVVVKAIPGAACVQETLRRFGVAIPQSLLGVERALALHDWIVARRLERLQGSVDLIHCWPDASLRTLQVARRLGIPSVLERPCAHTAFAYDIVNAECRREGIRLPQNHCHALRPKRLAHEEREYEWADALLCPSDFVVRTLREREIPLAKLQRHQYGYDPALFSPNGSARRREGRPLSMIFVGRCSRERGCSMRCERGTIPPRRNRAPSLSAGNFSPVFAGNWVHC